jgi:hypothetical protein
MVGRINKHSNGGRSAWWTICVVALLLFAQVQGLTPLFFAGIAWIDGEHHVELAPVSGGSELVLKHDHGAGTPFSRDHEHCLMDRLLVVFANPSADTESDHVFSFCDGDDSEDSKHLKALPEAESPLPCPALIQIAMEIVVATQSFPVRPYLLPFSRPPPTPAVTAFIRQTVFLI